MGDRKGGAGGARNPSGLAKPANITDRLARAGCERWAGYGNGAGPLLSCQTGGPPESGAAVPLLGRRQVLPGTGRPPYMAFMPEMTDSPAGPRTTLPRFYLPDQGVASVAANWHVSCPQALVTVRSPPGPAHAASMRKSVFRAAIGTGVAPAQSGNHEEEVGNGKEVFV